MNGDLEVGASRADGVQMLGFDGRLAGVLVGHARRARFVVVNGDLSGGAVPASDQSVGDSPVQLAQGIARYHVDEHRGDAVVGEAVAAGLAVRPRPNEAGGDGFAHGEPDGGLAAGARIDDQSDVEVAAENRRRTENGLTAGRETREALGNQRGDPRRQAELGYGTPLPALAGMPERALLDQRADELREKERIAFGVAIDEGEELAADLLTVKRRRQPLLDFVAGQPGEHQLVCRADGA